MVSEAHPRKHREAVPGLVNNLGGPNQALGAAARGCLISFVPHEMPYPRCSMQWIESKEFVARVSEAHPRKHREAVPGLVSNLGGPNQALGAAARGCLISFVPHEMRYPRYSMQ
ncbi:hypothetical protein BV504_04070 [Halomonas sp. 'Soap Lake |nr:hypothetical protein BV504_04070 [Halomonas sp. 'Soap Lake \